MRARGAGKGMETRGSEGRAGVTALGTLEVKAGTEGE